MPCNCNGTTQGAGSAVQQAAETVNPALSSKPAGVCASAPCSTRQNVAEIQSTFTPPRGTDCSPLYPVPTPEELIEQRRYRPCTDQNGCTALYPEGCRDAFWPDFAHPRWLCCRDLYNVG